MMGPGRGDSCPILMARGEAQEPGSLVSCDQGLRPRRAEGLSRSYHVSSGWSGERGAGSKAVRSRASLVPLDRLQGRGWLLFP